MPDDQCSAEDPLEAGPRDSLRGRQLLDDIHSSVALSILFRRPYSMKISSSGL
jgi:hypothetical protein